MQLARRWRGDERVRFERAPFDHPEIIVPLDGAAPDNAPAPGFAAGREALLTAVDGAGQPLFRHVAAVGAAGSALPLKPFLELSSTDSCTVPPAVTNSHFCR